jgi:aspartate/methionine/tyrosine aminotransferase
MDAAAGPRTRAILLVQPNNPTGSCVRPEELAAIEDLAASRGLALVSDEVFGDFPWPPETRLLPSLLAEPRRVPTFVLGGVSKLCGLPQMKIGWVAVAGPDREVSRALEGLEWIADLFLSTSAPIESALPSLLSGRHRFQAVVRERLATNLDVLRSRTSGHDMRLLEPEGGWSAVLRRVADPDAAASHDSAGDLAERLLERHDVLAHPGHFYGLSDEHIVISLIVEPSILKEAVDRMTA